MPLLERRFDVVAFNILIYSSILGTKTDKTESILFLHVVSLSVYSMSCINGKNILASVFLSCLWSFVKNEINLLKSKLILSWSLEKLSKTFLAHLYTSNLGIFPLIQLSNASTKSLSFGITPNLSWIPLILFKDLLKLATCVAISSLYSPSNIFCSVSTVKMSLSTLIRLILINVSSTAAVNNFCKLLVQSLWNSEIEFLIKKSKVSNSALIVSHLI